MKTYLVLKDCLGRKAGDEAEFPPEDVVSFVASGKLLEKSAADKSEIDNSVEEVGRKMAQGLLSATLKSLENLAPSGTGFPIPGLDNSAQAKDHGSLGEWLWAAAGNAQTFDGSKASHCKNLLQNKYETKVNPKFGEEYQEAVSKGQGGWGSSADGQITKATVQQEGIGSLGGLTVPIQFSNEFFTLATPMSMFMGRCKRYTMTNKELWIPALDYSLGGSGKSPYLGGMNAAWTAENVAFQQQFAQVRQVKLNANMIAGITQSSRTLLADSPVAIAQVLTGLFAQAIAFNVDYAVFAGTGDGQPKGMTVSGACKTFTRGTWATAGALLTDLATADGYLIPEEEGNAIWVVPPSFKVKLYTLNDASSKVVFLPNFPGNDVGPAGIRPRMAIFGKPLYWSQLPPSAGTAGDVNLLIPSLYALGLREEIEIGVSEHVAWTSNLLTWRFMFRGDGQSLLNTTLTLQNGDVVAPFVSIH